MNCGNHLGKEKMLALDGAQIDGSFIKVQPHDPKMRGEEIFDFIGGRLRILEEVKGRVSGEQEKPITEGKGKGFAHFSGNASFPDRSTWKGGRGMLRGVGVTQGEVYVNTPYCTIGEGVGYYAQPYHAFEPESYDMSPYLYTKPVSYMQVGSQSFNGGRMGKGKGFTPTKGKGGRGNPLGLNSFPKSNLGEGQNEQAATSSRVEKK